MEKHVYKFGLTFLITFHLVNIFNWLNLHVWPVGKDWFIHLPNTYRMINSLNQDFSFNNLMFVDLGYPPFYYWMATFLLKVFFSNHRYIFLTPFAFLIILMLSVYGIGKQLKNRDVGFLAATFCSFFYIIYKTSIQYNLSLAAPAMTSLVIYLLLKCDGFKNRLYSILFGVSLGLGFLTRPFVVLFALGPIMITIWHNFKKDNKKREFLHKQKRINLTIFLCISCIIMILFLHNPLTSMDIFRRMSFVDGQINCDNIFTWSHLSFYLRVLPQQIGAIGTVFFLASFCLFLQGRGYRKEFILSWLMIPFCYLSLVYLKFSEYTMSYLPAVALVIANAIDEIKQNGHKKAIAVAFVVINLCLYFRNFT